MGTEFRDKLHRGGITRRGMLSLSAAFVATSLLSLAATTGLSAESLTQAYVTDSIVDGGYKALFTEIHNAAELAEEGAAAASCSVMPDEAAYEAAKALVRLYEQRAALDGVMAGDEATPDEPAVELALAEDAPAGDVTGESIAT